MIKVTCAIIIQNEKILLTQRGEHPHHPFQWEFPGGKIKPGEPETESILREIEEELDLQLEISDKLEPVVFDYGFKKIELIPFICFIRDGKIKLNEHVDYRWIQWQEAGNMNISEADKKIITNENNSRLFKKYIGKQVNNSR
jgi:8-oxo-dGTP diphosphatase